MHQIGSTIVEEMTIVETGTYNRQWRRAFNTNLDGNGMQMFKQALDDMPSYRPSMLNGIANQFIMPSAQPEKELYIPGGFSDQRYRFYMKLVHTWRMGGRIIEYVVGYSNFPGIALNGGFANDMEFYVNSTTMVRETQEQTPMGVQTINNISDNSHVLVDNHWDGIYTGNTEQRMRPEDVFSTMSRSHLQGIATVVDARATMSNVAVKSARQNSLAPAFMANVLENYKNAQIAESFGQGEQQILSTARGYVADNSVGRDPFLSAISNIRGTPLGNTFSWQNLLALDPGAGTRTTTIKMGNAEKATAHWSGQTAEWHSADRTTLVATILAQSVPGLMVDTFLNKVVFVVTNHVQGGGYRFTPIFGKSFTSMTMDEIMPNFSMRLQQEVLNDLTYNNAMGFHLEMHADLLGETFIKISIDGEPPTDYLVPSFCDAMMVPVITNNADNAMAIATDFELLLGNIRTCNGDSNKESAFGLI